MARKKTGKLMKMHHFTMCDEDNTYYLLFDMLMIGIWFGIGIGVALS